MTIPLEESLARKLYAIYFEAIGVLSADLDFDSEPDYIKEAWIQLAQSIESQLPDHETPDHR
jgi:hypothetical protein